MLVISEKCPFFPEWTFAIFSMYILLFQWKRTQWLSACRNSVKVGDGRFTEGLFDGLCRIVQFAVQRAKVYAVQSKRALVKPTYRLDRVDNLQDGQLIRCHGEDKASVKPTLRAHQARSVEALHHFGKIANWRLRLFRNFTGGPRDGLLGQVNDGPQRVLGCLSYQL